MTTKSTAQLLSGLSTSTFADAQQWTPTRQALPPEGQVVDTMTENGLRQPLKRQGRLWFHPDGGMYVYYTPLLWKPATT